MKTFTFPALNGQKWNSRINSANVQNSERWLGYFFGPAGVILLNGIIGSYLNVFYTDVLKVGGLWGGMFLTIVPVLSKMVDAVTNILMGRIIDNTRSRQGKARPWILVSAPLFVISAILLFTIPDAGDTVKVIWILFSFNLYYSVAYTIYYMSHSMLVPLSTRNTKQRDGIAMLQNMAMCIIPGFVVAMLFPMLILPAIGVDQKKWIELIIIFSIVALPCVFIEYFFTKERITEETVSLETEDKPVNLKKQMKACFSSKYWIIIMTAIAITQLCTSVQTTSLIYYCNWVLGTYNDGVTQTIVSAVGNAPLGFGILIMWPLVNKFGKKNVMLAGFVVALAGVGIFMANPTSMGIVLVGLMIRAFGALPITYIMMAMLSDALDHVEWKAGFRCDGFSMSVYTIIFTVFAGISQGAFNLGLSVFGYIPPAADGTFVEQSETVKNFFVFGYQGLFAIGMAVMFVLLLFYKVEDELPQIHKDITERHKKEAAEKGIVWLSPEEIAQQEQKEQERIAEENRIRELKERCAKKGLNYQAEEEKYQRKLAEQKEKAERKKKK